MIVRNYVTPCCHFEKEIFSCAKNIGIRILPLYTVRKTKLSIKSKLLNVKIYLRFFSPQFKSQLHFFVSEPLPSGIKRMQAHFQSPSSSSSLNIWLSRSRLDEVLLLLAVRITFPPPISPGMVSISVFYVRDFSCIGCLLTKSSSLERSGDWHGASNFSK